MNEGFLQRVMNTRGAECEAKSLMVGQEPSLKDGLLSKKERYEKMLVDINAAIQALETNPAVETVLNLIAKTGRY